MSTEAQRKKLIIRLQTIFSKKGISKEERAAIVHDFTNGKELSVGRLSTNELSELIDRFTDKQVSDDAPNRMRRKIIALFRERGFEYYDHASNRTKADMHRIYKWVKHYGKHNPKRLKDYTYSELIDLVSQVETLHNRELIRDMERLFPGDG